MVDDLIKMIIALGEKTADAVANGKEVDPIEDRETVKSVVQLLEKNGLLPERVEQMKDWLVETGPGREEYIVSPRFSRTFIQSALPILSEIEAGGNQSAKMVRELLTEVQNVSPDMFEILEELPAWNALVSTYEGREEVKLNFEIEKVEMYSRSVPGPEASLGELSSPQGAKVGGQDNPR